MLRTRLVAPLAGLAATLVGGPILATVALAADPIVVQSGDTLTSLSKRHDVRISTLVELNDIVDPNRIFAGQRLRIAAPAPTAPAATAPAAAPRTHTVAYGENLTFIARRYGVTVARIVAANGIANPSRVFAGQRLTIPIAGAAPPAAPAATPA